MQMEQVFLLILPASRVSIVKPMFHDHFHLNATLYQKDKRVTPGNLQKRKALSHIEEYWTVTFTLSILLCLKRLIFLTMDVELAKY